MVIKFYLILRKSKWLILSGNFNEEAEIFNDYFVNITTNL